MMLTSRLIVAASCLTLGVLAQFGLQHHLSGSGELSYPPLNKKLAEFPMQLASPENTELPRNPVSLGAWQGEVHPDSATLPTVLWWAEEFICRSYIRDPNTPAVRVSITYSVKAMDREHHPEICMRDAGGAVEDLSSRKLFYLDAEQKRPVQRFRFRTQPQVYTTVYYWHYTLDPPTRPDQTLLQRLHQSMGRRPPSVTVQVSTVARVNDLEKIENSFLGLVDNEMRRHHLPETARMGCDRLPVKLNWTQ